MKRSEQRILTTHVGSLIRPGTLLDAAKDRDPAHRGAYERELKGAVADVVSRQAKAGIDVVNDGEFGKSGWANLQPGALERVRAAAGQALPGSLAGPRPHPVCGFHGRGVPARHGRLAGTCLR